MPRPRGVPRPIDSRVGPTRAHSLADADKEIPMQGKLAFVAVALVVALGAGRLSADEVRGKVKQVDGEKGTLTLTVGEADKSYEIGDARVTALYGKKLKKATSRDLAGGLRSLKEGSEVTLTTAKKDDKDVVTEVKLEGLQAKVKKKNKKAKAD